MVQLHPELELTLSALGSSGIVLSREAKAALHYSLALKEAEAGAKGLTFWGRILTTSGKDYLIAKAIVEGYVLDGKAVLHSKFFFSQDAVQWLDLENVSDTIVELCRHLSSQLSGDPAKRYELPHSASAGSAQEDHPSSSISELQRLRAIIEDVDVATSLVPSGSQVVAASTDIAPNMLFSGAPYPEKLEAYRHAQAGPDGATLAEDVRGIWSIHWDPFSQVATVRCLLYPGYAFYYNHKALTWGGLYMGSGLKNNDLIFAL